jgi:phenylalanyl-tRNA synthetase beta chain
MAQTLARNLNRGERDVRFYEIGKGYGIEKGQRFERCVLTLGAAGRLRENSLHESAREFDFFDLKGAVEAVLEPYELAPLRFEPLNDTTAFDPVLSAAAWAGNERFAVLGQLSKGVAAAFKLRQPVWLAEVDLEALYAQPLRGRRYQPLSRFPAVERDFSLLLADGVSFGALRASIERLRIPEIIRLVPVDRYRGAPVPAGRYSLLLRVTFQSAEQTLTDAQVNAFAERIVRALESELDARLRG